MQIVNVENIPAWPATPPIANALSSCTSAQVLGPAIDTSVGAKRSFCGMPTLLLFLKLKESVA
jgi:hypothetical protein